ncbi:hypothetical protein DH2020_034782 [Rehmannia glutinosa]|uniref:Uncharacterized protein n=1 Tax=Rehmannia glutinosa TaxID=99300 RepID=A0ABR0VBL6_REHGL
MSLIKNIAKKHFCYIQRQKNSTDYQFSIADKQKIKQSQRLSVNVNEEYLCAVRTKSYAEFFIKFQLLVNDPSSPSPSSSSPACSNPWLTEVLLDPGQETITTILESSSLFPNESSSVHLKSLLSNYFDISAEASNFCSHLLRNLNQLQSDYKSIHQAIESIDYDRRHYSSEELRSCTVILNSPNFFPNLKKQDFKHIHEKHASILHRLKSNRTSVARKMKMIRCVNTASGVCATAACGLLAAAAIFLAAHTLTALLLGPAIFTFPMKRLKRKIRRFRFLKYGSLRKIVEQLDVAAKGAYILNRDFDTMSRLVGRLEDEIEHNRAMIKFCLERREDRFCLQVLKEIKKYEFGFKKQVEELEEHVYLCLVTINRARGLVIKEICKGCVEN